MEQYLQFTVDGLRCAVPLAVISRVIRMVRFSHKPDTPPWEAGTINLHGTDIPVIAMRVVVGMPVIPPRLSDMLIIAYDGTGDVALWVDATSDVVEFPPASVPESGGSTPVTDQRAAWITPDGIHVFSDLGSLRTHKTAGAVSIPVSVEHAGGLEYDPYLLSTDSLLDERAKRIAQPEVAESNTPVIEVLKFRLAYCEFALEMKYIREVILTGEITPVPGTPEYISGICIVRGEIISLVDLRALLSIPEKGLTDLNRVIVLTNRRLTFGILADQITGIGILELNGISPDASEFREKGGCYIKGVAEKALTVLDAQSLFDDPRMVIEDP